jgi:hypothetical protein
MKYGLKVILFTICSLFSKPAYTQEHIAIKTNLLYGAVTYTPNLSLEYGVGERTTINLTGSINYWNMRNTLNKGEKLAHWILQPEFRYWTRQRLSGHFFGVHALYSHYNIGGKNLPMLFGKHSDNYRYEGASYGGGLNYGYSLPLTSRIALEFEIGAGYMHLDYDQYHAYKCGKFIQPDSRNYFGITKAGISFVWKLF